MKTPSFLTLPEVALLMQVSVRHARRLVRDNLIPAPVRFGRCHRWPKAQIEAWAASGCKHLPEGSATTPEWELQQAKLATEFYAAKAARLQAEIQEAAHA